MSSGHSPTALNMMAIDALKAGRPARARELCAESIGRYPGHVPGWVNFGIASQDLGNHHDADTSYRQALWLDPRNADAHSNLANLLAWGGDPERAARHFRRAAEILDTPEAWSLSLSFGLHVGYDREAHQRWAERFAGVVPGPSSPVPCKGPLRVGFLSSCFREHTMPHYLEPVLERLDRRLITPVLIGDMGRPDAVTDRLLCLAGGACHVAASVPDEELARILAERADVVIELDGHKEGNRLRAVALWQSAIGNRKSAMSYIGYLADTFVTEDLNWIGFAYKPHDYALPLLRPPCHHNGFITFGHPGRECKITLETAKLWGRILQAVPTARLRVWAAAGERNRPLRRRLEGAGVDGGRLELIDRCPDLRGYLESITTIDIALDPAPFPGFATTCELLWQGIPTVTMAGPEPYQHAAEYFAKAAGLHELIAYTPDHYVLLAAELAGWGDWLSQARATMRERLRKSPLLDGAAAARRFERAVLRGN